MFPKFLNPIEAQSIYEIILGAVLALLFWPVAFILTCINVTLRFLSQAACNHYFPGRFKIACGEDSVFGVKLQGSCKSFIHGYKIIRGKPDLEVIRSKFQQLFNQTDSYDKLKHAMTDRFGYFCWDTQVPFEINNHIRLLDDFDPEEIVDEAKIADICSKLSARKCGDDRPQWEVLMIPKYKMTGELLEDNKTSHYALIVRLHHAYCDGISFVLMTNNFLSDIPGELPLDPTKEFKNPIWMKAYIWAKIVIVGPMNFLKNLFMLVFTANRFRVDRYVNSKVMARSSTLEMDTLKKIREASGTSVTSITLSAVYGALHKTHMRLFPGKPLPKRMHLGSVGVLLPYKENPLVNQFTMWPYTAPLIAQDPQMRLAVTYEGVRKCASQPDPLFNFFMQRALGSLPKIWHEILFSLSGTPVMLSNVPGYKTAVKLFGGELVDVAAWIPLVTTTGIGLSTQSYCGKIHFSAIVDPQLFATAADLKVFLEEIVNEINILAQEFAVDKDGKLHAEIAPTSLDRGILRKAEQSARMLSTRKDANDNEEPEISLSTEVAVSVSSSSSDCDSLPIVRSRKEQSTCLRRREEPTPTNHNSDRCVEKGI